MKSSKAMVAAALMACCVGLIVIWSKYEPNYDEMLRSVLIEPGNAESAASYLIQCQTATVCNSVTPEHFTVGDETLDCELALKVATGSSDDRRMKGQRAFKEFALVGESESWSGYYAPFTSDDRPDLWHLLSPMYYASAELRYLASTQDFRSAFGRLKQEASEERLATLFVLDKVVECSESTYRESIYFDQKYVEAFGEDFGVGFRSRLQKIGIAAAIYRIGEK